MQTARFPALLALVAAACVEPEGPSMVCATFGAAQNDALRRPDRVDLLLMIDNSNSMAQEQALLRAELPRLIDRLATGDADRDGVRELLPVRSLHVGVITSDLGAGDVPIGTSVPSCDAGFGDDGIMRLTSRDGPGCDATYPSRVFSFEPGVDAPAPFTTAVSCVADVGTGGCAFEQQLEAILKALSPASPSPWVASGYEAPRFWGGTLGHGDGLNAGFLRGDAILAIILLSDEEDCSVPDPSISHPDAPAYAGNPLNLRCSRFPESLYPVERYIDGYLQLRERPWDLVFVPIVGVPEDAVVGEPGCDAVLRDPRLIETEEPADPPQRLLPSCDTPDGVAYPPRRILEVACGLSARGASVSVESICAPSQAPAIDAVVGRVARAMSSLCIDEPIAIEADGRAACRLAVVLPDGGRCEDEGLARIGTSVEDERVREVCRVPGVTPDDGIAGRERGFWLDDRPEPVRAACGTGPPRRIVAFSRLALPAGAQAHLECATELLPSGTLGVSIGTPCTPFTEVPGEDVCPGAAVPNPGSDATLSCDPLTRACGVACDVDSDCVAARLSEQVCDWRWAIDAVGGRSARLRDMNGDGAVDTLDAAVHHGFCVEPGC